jgi:phospholipid transport system substrate-binding protein
MAKRALGKPWKDQSVNKQKEFVGLFKELLFNNYVDRVEQYTGSGESFAYDKEVVEGEYSYVKTRILNYKNAQVSVDYRLRVGPDGWKAYDVVIEGISLINNYRSQFNSILARSSFDELLLKMQEKARMQAGRS